MTTRQQWQYMQTDHPWPKMAGDVVDLPQKWAALELGANGWELVGVVRTPSGTLSAFWKRQIVEEPTGAMVVMTPRVQPVKGKSVAKVAAKGKGGDA